jgi:hypothetical protein
MNEIKEICDEVGLKDCTVVKEHETVPPSIEFRE